MVTPNALRATTARPTGIERPYEREEIIVSKTDLRGVITYANDVFLRVSGFTEDEVAGRAHNLVRHPDMPRAVFRLMWTAIEAGQEIFAYIVNLAADGGHYWVFAHVTPSVDLSGRVVGYHSNRRWVEPEIAAEVAALYAVVSAAERRETRTPAAIEAGVAAVRAILADRGQSYDEFVWSLASRTPMTPR
jgi:PAS domain S-box-containing protein